MEKHSAHAKHVSSGHTQADGSVELAAHDKVILSEDEMRRALSRIAHEIMERNGGAADLVLGGLRTRGVPLAARLARRIEELEQVRVPLAELDTTPFRDDRPRDQSQAEAALAPLAVSITDKVIILVDDVLFTGRTARCALDALLAHGRPRKIQLAVLIDRGHRELPIRADYVGKNIPTSLSESIAVRLRETDGADAVVLRRAQPTTIGE